MSASSTNTNTTSGTATASATTIANTTTANNNIDIFSTDDMMMNSNYNTSTIQQLKLLTDRYGIYALEILINLNKQLSQLVINIVHSLASQVAFSIDSKSTDTYRLPTNRLQRMPSGPDTLSQSLFDMLYAELFYGLKSIIKSVATSDMNLTTGVANANTTAGKYDLYIMYICCYDYFYYI